MELKEARGKTIKKMTVVSDFDQKDVDIEFEDGSFLHVGLTAKIEAKVRFEKDEAVTAA
jgi:hypothetical protein